MANLGTLKSRVATRLKDPNYQAVSEAEVTNVINDAIAFWAKRKFWFNDVSQNVTLVAGDPVLPSLSTDLEFIYDTAGIVINYASTRYRVNKVSVDEYDAMNVEGQGIPFAFTYRNGQYVLYYYPDAAYTAIVRGIKAYTALANDNDTNDFTTEAESLIMYEALSRAYAEFRQDEKMETYYSARAQNEYTNLKRKTRTLAGSGRNQVECM